MTSGMGQQRRESAPVSVSPVLPVVEEVWLRGYWLENRRNGSRTARATCSRGAASHDLGFISAV
jgi:hypothetical protein